MFARLTTAAPLGRGPDLNMALDLNVAASSQVTLAVTGASALLLFLLMGVIRTTARSDYTIYGVMKESDSYGIFQAPSKGFYP